MSVYDDDEFARDTGLVPFAAGTIVGLVVGCLCTLWFADVQAKKAEGDIALKQARDTQARERKEAGDRADVVTKK